MPEGHFSLSQWEIGPDCRDRLAQLSPNWPLFSLEGLW